MNKYFLIIFFSILSSLELLSQKTDSNIFGDVKSENTKEHLPFVNIHVKGTTIGTTTDISGHYMLTNLPVGKHIIVAKFMGYETKEVELDLIKNNSIELNFIMKEKVMTLSDIVITGTKTFKRKTESPVIVGIIDSKLLENVNASSLSEGLNYQSGVRVETNCQTCNYTQLRMNGLAGGYSQILINGRPIFSPLTGLYGMEQIPKSMIERVEIVKGAGSSLYGSSAIGGTVNLITKYPNESSYEFSYTNQIIDTETNEYFFNGNINFISNNRNSGVSIFVAKRNRDWYDNNDDNFSELPKIKNNSFGAKLYYKPLINHKLELNFSSLYEYRYGGEMVDKPSYLSQQSEERVHNILMGGIDYSIHSLENEKNSIDFYISAQKTDRDHYTGIIPDEEEEIEKHKSNPPYGITDNYTYQIGSQINYEISSNSDLSNYISLGLEYVRDKVEDNISAYNYNVNQNTENSALFIQDDIKINNNINGIIGIRFDKHNLLEDLVISPRLSIMYKYMQNYQLRATYGKGFRAPQAFDTDLHIAFAGGGVSRIKLSSNLKEEKSDSFSFSLNYDKASSDYIIGYTIEGFYTNLKNSFFLSQIGEDNHGEIFEKQNGDEAKVMGLNCELRANYNRKIEMSAGLTIQKSEYNNKIKYLEDEHAIKEFLRTPKKYGFLNLSLTPNRKYSVSINTVYTGEMKIIKMSNDSFGKDRFVNTEDFWDANLKLNYFLKLPNSASDINLFAGLKNILNNYQSDFDRTKNRDSNYVYGPSLPRTIYFGIKLGSF
ncbi:MAG: TonB-dependent receptor [Marinifilaceae bacterium]|jgi:outer membrane receptor for ferrienterochelin and colicins|nr:TonB-dependent receptor [Marinifilaceae bacterium]